MNQEYQPAVTTGRYKNVIFDLGGVLIYFNPRELIEKIFVDSEQKPYHLTQAVYTQSWLDMDRGKLTRAEVVQNLASTYDAAQLEKFLEALPLYFTPLADGLRIVHDVKSAGYKVFVLSNLADFAHEAILRHAGFFDVFDGAVFSYQVGFAKPDLEIYQSLLTKYNLIADECVFIDDLVKNIDAGKTVGIDGIVCDDYTKVRAELVNRGILIT